MEPVIAPKPRNGAPARLVVHAIGVRQPGTSVAADGYELQTWSLRDASRRMHMRIADHYPVELAVALDGVTGCPCCRGRRPAILEVGERPWAATLAVA